MVDSIEASDFPPETLRDQNNRFKILIDSLPTGIVMVDRTGLIVLCNEEVEKMFGYNSSELTGTLIEKLVPTRFRKNHPESRNKFMQNPSKRQMGAGRDLAGLCKDGREIPVEIGLNHIIIDEQTYVIASVVDITERKQIESRLQKAYDEVQQKNLEMEQFVYTVSHDLKAPLVTSSSFISFIREDLKEGNFDELQDSFERLEKAHKRMQELINDLLQLSRVGRMELQLTEVNLSNVIYDVLESLAERITTHNIQVEVNGHYPTVWGDQRRLYQVFENLLTNAIKYGAGGVPPKINFISQDHEKEIWIGLQDNGPGIPPQYHKKIFGLFQRLDNSKEGTGVGLAIVARIMQLHGGRAWVESKEGDGSTFWVAIPKELTKGGL